MLYAYLTPLAGESIHVQVYQVKGVTSLQVVLSTVQDSPDTVTLCFNDVNALHRFTDSLIAQLGDIVDKNAAQAQQPPVLLDQAAAAE